MCRGARKDASQRLKGQRVFIVSIHTSTDALLIAQSPGVSRAIKERSAVEGPGASRNAQAAVSCASI